MFEATIPDRLRAILRARPQLLRVRIAPEMMRRTVFAEQMLTLPELPVLRVRVQVSLTWRPAVGRLGRATMMARPTAAEATVYDPTTQRWEPLGRLPVTTIHVDQPY